MKRLFTTQDLNIRLKRPHRQAPLKGQIFKGFEIEVEDQAVTGENIDGNARWFRNGDDFYWSGGLSEVEAPSSTSVEPARVEAPSSTPVEPARGKVDWNQSLFNVPAAWRQNQGEGIRIAVLDSGVFSHEDLLAALTGEAKDFSEKGLADNTGHGTRCAGIIAARSNAPDGVIGVAPKARIINAKIEGPTGIAALSIERAIKWAVEELSPRVDIVSMSLGNVESDEITRLIQTHTAAGVVFVAAAGDGRNINQTGADQLIDIVSFPARLKECISIGAISQSFFNTVTNTGLTLASNLDFVAPFIEIYSTDIPQHGNYTPTNGNRDLAKGSSFSAPFVSGLAALILKEFEPDPTRNRTDLVRKKLSEIVVELRALMFGTDPYMPVVKAR